LKKEQAYINYLVARCVQKKLHLHNKFFTMKHIGRFILLAISVVLVSCNAPTLSVFPIEIEEQKVEVKDSIIIDVDYPGPIMELKGNIKIIEGACELIMRNEKADTVFYERYDIVGNNKIEYDFIREVGQWTLIYDVQKIDKVSPQMSIDLKVQYEN